MAVPVTCKYGESPIKNKGAILRKTYKSMGAIGCRGNSNFDQICPKALCDFPPPQVMQDVKFNQDEPTVHRDIQV